MTDKKATLVKLNENLNILQEREAKYGGNAPLDLLNQIEDHKQAIDLTRQVITDELSEDEWEEALKPLLLAIDKGQVVNIEAETSIAGDVTGDVVGRDKIIHETHYHYVERPSSSIPFLAPNLPPHHVPRGLELATLRNLLLGQERDVAVTALRGMGGIGKTTLAIALCHDKQIIDAFPDGILWATLGPQADLLSAQVAWGMAFDEDLTNLPDAEARASLLRSLLYDKRCFLVIDDIWDTSHISPMQVGGPQCATLVTTRERKVAQKVGVAHDLDVLEPDQAIALLERWVGEIAEDEKAVAGELAKRLGYLPLGLALAGAQTQEGETWEELLAVFRNAQGADITLLDLDDPAVRDESLALTFDLSLKRLGEALPEQFAMLGVFAAGREAPFSAEAAAAVWEVKPISAKKKVLRRLVQAAILDKEEENYTLHLVLGDYARSQLNDDKRKYAEIRHQTHYLEVLKRSEKDWQTVETAMPQIRTAWKRIASNDSDSLYAWATAANTFFNLRGLWDDKIAWVEAVLIAAHSAGQREREGWCENELGITFYNLGELDRALEHCQTSRELYREMGDRIGEATSRNYLGGIYDRRGELDVALEHFQASLAISRDLTAHETKIFARNHIGLIHQKRGELDLALSQYEENLAIAREIGDRANIAESLRNVGFIYNRRGDLDSALSTLEQSLTTFKEIGHRKGEARLLAAIGSIHQRQNEFDKALVSLNEGLQISQEIRDRVVEANTLNSIGFVYSKLGELNTALDYNMSALAIREKLGDRVAEAHSLGTIGGVYDLRGDPEKALYYYERSLALFRDANNLRGEAIALSTLGEFQLAQGEFHAALEYFFAGLSIIQEVDQFYKAGLLQGRAIAYSTFLPQKHLGHVISRSAATRNLWLQGILGSNGEDFSLLSSLEMTCGGGAQLQRFSMRSPYATGCGRYL